MSLHIDFEPHSWYMGFAIQKDPAEDSNDKPITIWRGYTDNGNTYRVNELLAPTLKELKQEIKHYRGKA
jgi:hypothetical protein